MDYSQLTEMALESFSDAEKKILGFGNEAHKEKMCESLIEQIEYHNKNIVGEDTFLKDNGGVEFHFEDIEDAKSVYDFIVNTKLMNCGEISINESTVVFERSAVFNKSDIVKAVMVAFDEEVILENEEDEYQYNSLVDILTEINTSGAPKQSKKGNPFHGKKDGKFTSPFDQIADGGGSWSDGVKKVKLSKAGKNKQGETVAHYSGTKHPCGRAARRQGKNIRCWSGDTPKVVRLAKNMKSAKKRYEDLSMEDKALVLELRAQYRRLG